MLHSRHIVVADFPDGRTRTLYQGPDQAAAEKAMELAIARAEAEAVIIFSHPLITRMRLPLQEAAEAERRAEEAEALKTAAITKEAQDLAAKKAQHAALTAEIAELEKAQDPDPEPAKKSAEK